MRILVCGSRHMNDFFILKEELDKLPVIETVIHGDAQGADRMTGTWARTWGIKEEKYPADWKKHGKAAGPIRNKQMLDEGKPDLVIAFMAKDSRGTKNMVDQAVRAGIEVKVIHI